MPDFKEEVRLRLARLNLEPSREAAIVEEMAQHMEQRLEELVVRGSTHEAARAAVLKEIQDGGGMERDLLRVEKQVAFEPASLASPSLSSWLAHLKKDLRHALR